MAEAKLTIIDRMKIWAFPVSMSIISFYLFATFKKLDEVHADIHAVKTSIEVLKKDIDYSKATVSDHEGRLRDIEKKGTLQKDNTRVGYQTYNN
jgi:cell division protein FtsL